MRQLLLFVFNLTAGQFFAQTNPAITSWIINTAGQTGFAGIATNVQQVQYSANNVYVSTNDIADWIPLGYDWPNNPWFPEAQNFVFKITLHPEEKQGVKTLTPYGHIGIWTNGVSIYNPKDAHTWEEGNTWFQNAFYFEHLDMETFDPCLGHPNNMHEYHLHVNPTCLYDDADSSQHAPLIGFAFDGFPIYGAYGFKNPDGTGGVTRMRSSYRLRNISYRSTLPNGTVLPASLHGPALSQYPLGAYVEDFELAAGSGTLDEFNGRFCVTPEYPEGVYAYFVTIDESQEPVYPYVLGPRYYGVVQPGNTGPNSGYNIITEPVDVFTSATEPGRQIVFRTYPNPADEALHFFLIPSYESNLSATLSHASGAVARHIEPVQTAVTYSFDLRGLPAGTYFLSIKNKGLISTQKIIVK